MFGLVDGNNFYVSCERVFDLRLIGKPVVVLSNNDGCVIARSNEAKSLGIGMGQPIHEVKSLIKRENVIVRSANFALYGDMSGRIVTILRDLAPHVEVYSIDECFITFEGVRDAAKLGEEVRQRILKWTGIPCSVGLGTTKTLAKVANKVAKKGAGIADMADDNLRESTLTHLPVEDLWGVGYRLTARLGQDGILTAAQLRDANTEMLRARYGVVMERTQRELKGTSCYSLEEVEPERQQIVVSRSFGREVETLQEVSQALATFAIRAAEKLRVRSLKASGVWVWVHTNPFHPGAKQYHPSRALSFAIPTSDTRIILATAQKLLRSMFKLGYRYKKAGVGLLDLMPADLQQGDLFTQAAPRSATLMQVLDKTNRKFGRGSLGFGASGWRTEPVWGMKQESKSFRYTTRWGEILRVN